MDYTMPLGLIKNQILRDVIFMVLRPHQEVNHILNNGIILNKPEVEFLLKAHDVC